MRHPDSQPCRWPLPKLLLTSKIVVVETEVRTLAGFPIHLAGVRLNHSAISTPCSTTLHQPVTDLEMALVELEGRSPQVLQQRALVCEGKVEAQITAVFPECYLPQVVRTALCLLRVWLTQLPLLHLYTSCMQDIRPNITAGACLEAAQE